MSARDGLREAQLKAALQSLDYQVRHLIPWRSEYEGILKDIGIAQAALAADAASEQASPTVREQLNQMFGKDKVDYAIAEAAQPATEKQPIRTEPPNDKGAVVMGGASAPYDPSDSTGYIASMGEGTGANDLEHRAASQETSAPPKCTCVGAPAQAAEYCLGCGKPKSTGCDCPAGAERAAEAGTPTIMMPFSREGAAMSTRDRLREALRNCVAQMKHASDLLEFMPDDYAECIRLSEAALAADAPEQAVCKNCGRPLSEHRGDGRCPVLPTGAFREP